MSDENFNVVGHQCKKKGVSKFKMIASVKPIKEIDFNKDSFPKDLSYLDVKLSARISFEVYLKILKTLVTKKEMDVLAGVANDINNFRA